MKVNGSNLNVANAALSRAGHAAATLLRGAGDLYTGGKKLASKVTLKQVATASLLLAAPAKASYTPLQIDDTYDGANAPTVKYFTGPEGLAGAVVGNLMSMYWWGKGYDEQYDAPALVANYLNLAIDRCNVTASETPNNASKPIPGNLESWYYVAAYVNRYNDSRGLDPRVGCLFGLGQQS